MIRRAPAILLVGPWLVLACASPDPVALPGGLSGEDVDAAAGYEAPPEAPASALLPPALRQGPHHRVGESVHSDGFLRLYTLESDFGRFAVRGEDLLRTRVAEIEALALLDAMSETREFASAAVDALKSPFVASWNLVRHPVGSIVGVPLEAWDRLRRTAELARSERSELEASALAEFLGFEREKRRIAYELRVDPYSSNVPLQRALNRFAWVSTLGRLPGIVVPFQGKRRSALARIDAPAAQRLADLLLHYAPEDLRRLNRIELAVMGVPKALADAFLAHPWFSPRHQTVLVESLSALDLTANRSALLRAALSATSEADALNLQRTAELLRAYHDHAGSLARLALRGASVVGFTAEGRRVVPWIADHALWARPTAFRADGLGPGEGRAAPETDLLVSGTVSQRARSELEARGLRVMERAFDRLAPPAMAEPGAAP